jgi:hypothetical protein
VPRRRHTRRSRVRWPEISVAEVARSAPVPMMLRQAGWSLCYACRCSGIQRRYLAHAATTSLLQDTSPAAPNSSAEQTVSTEGAAKKSRGKRAAKRKPESPEPKQSARDFSEPTNLDRWLAQINTSGRDPSLDDLERLRPIKHSDPGSETYATEYGTLVDQLCRTFSKTQLQRFVEMYGMDGWLCNPRRKKVEHAESIVERQWGWPSLKEVENQKRDRTEVQVKGKAIFIPFRPRILNAFATDFPLDARQLFLMMGKGTKILFAIIACLSKLPGRWRGLAADVY